MGGGCCYSESTFPSKWGACRNLLERPQLDLAPDQENWTPSIAHCQERGRGDPGALATLSLEFTLAGARNQPFLNKLPRLRQAASLLFRPPNAGELDSICRVYDDAGRLISSAKKAQSRTLGDFGAGDSIRRYVVKSPNFLNLGTSAKLEIIIIRKSNLPKRRYRRFFYKASRKNSLKSIRRSIKGFASAAWRYFALCEIQGAKPSPVQEEPAEDRIPISKDAPTFANYLNFIKKECLLYGDKVDRLTPAAANIARVLKLAGGPC